MKRLLALIAALAALAAPTAAGNISDNKVGIAKVKAANYWGVRKSCPPRTVQIRWKRLGDTVGQAPIGGCKWTDDGGQTYPYRFIELNRKLRNDYTASQWCNVIVHEYGHLVGKRHSDNPKSIMYPVIQKPLRRCEDL